MLVPVTKRNYTKPLLKQLVLVDIGVFIYERILRQIKDAYGYYIVTLHKGEGQKTVKVHKLVAIAFLNHTPCGLEWVINHKDFDKSNNAISNLEVVTNRQNSSHRQKAGSSVYTGVSWHKVDKRWRSQIRINGIRVHLGSFINEIDAHNEYQNKLKTLRQ